jgi:plasmid maintenance system antidote protein VapI
MQTPVRHRNLLGEFRPEALSIMDATARALRMGSPLGTSAEMWLQMQTTYDCSRRRNRRARATALK